MTEPDRAAKSPRTFADKLNKLMEVLAIADGKPMTANGFLADFKAKTGVAISKGYLSELRNGVVTAPRVDLVQALAQYFGVRASYFLDSEEDEINAARLELLDSLKVGGAMNLGLRATGLSAQTIQSIAQIIDTARKLEGLEPIEDEAEG